MICYQLKINSLVFPDLLWQGGLFYYWRIQNSYSCQLKNCLCKGSVSLQRQIEGACRKRNIYSDSFQKIKSLLLCVGEYGGRLYIDAEFLCAL